MNKRPITYPQINTLNFKILAMQVCTLEGFQFEVSTEGSPILIKTSLIEAHPIGTMILDAGGRLLLVTT